MSGRVWEDCVCAGEGVRWGRMSEAVKVMGRQCQLAGGWGWVGTVSTAPACTVEGDEAVILGALPWGAGNVSLP